MTDDVRRNSRGLSKSPFQLRRLVEAPTGAGSNVVPPTEPNMIDLAAITASLMDDHPEPAPQT